MPPTNANDPVRATDHDPSVATPRQDDTADLAPGSSPVNGGTEAYVLGQDAEPMGAVPERDPGTVSVPGYAKVGCRHFVTVPGDAIDGSGATGWNS